MLAGDSDKEIVDVKRFYMFKQRLFVQCIDLDGALEQKPNKKT